MRNRLALLTALVAVVPCFGGCAASANRGAGTVATAATGAPSARRAALPLPLPAVPVQTIEGKPVQLAELLAGHPALISLWATWCEACGEEEEPLRRLQAVAGERGGRVVGIAVGEPIDKVRAVALQKGLPWTQLVDPDFRFADALGEKQVPTTLVVDGQGRVAFIGGKLDEAALSALRLELTRVASPDRPALQKAPGEL